jgi:hypothetical protein
LIKIQVTGVTVAQRRLEAMREGAKKLGSTRILVGSNLKYAFGIEYGRHRGGRLARRAGGAGMLQKGLAAIEGSLPRDIAAALEAGGSVYDAVFRNALRVVDVTMANTPVKTGTLRRSFHVSTRNR